MRTGKLTAVWCSSALINPIIKMTVKTATTTVKRAARIEGPQTGFAYSLRQLFSAANLLDLERLGFERMDWT